MARKIHSGYSVRFRSASGSYRLILGAVWSAGIPFLASAGFFYVMWLSFSHGDLITDDVMGNARSLAGEGVAVHRTHDDNDGGGGTAELA
eukprot:COSAG05_NODE_4443_length_1512_cov_5.246285_3_plen_90_part_00